MPGTKMVAQRAILHDNPYQPRMARIVRIVPMVEDNHLFTVRFLDEADTRAWAAPARPVRDDEHPRVPGKRPFQSRPRRPGRAYWSSVCGAWAG